MNQTRLLSVERSTSTAHRLLHYDGVCGNVHGHNMDWDVDVEVSMADTGEDNMPVDLKEIASMIDDVDHTMVLNVDDPLLDHRELLGDKSIVVIEGDPTCEELAQWMASRLVKEIDAASYARVELAETDKYGIAAEAYSTNVEDDE